MPVTLIIRGAYSFSACILVVFRCIWTDVDLMILSDTVLGKLSNYPRLLVTRIVTATTPQNQLRNHTNYSSLMSISLITFIEQL